MTKMHPEAAKLLDEIYAYLDLSNAYRSTFGREAANDSHFIERLEHGRIPKLTTIDRVRDYIARQTKVARPR